MANVISYSGAFNPSTLQVPGVFLNILPITSVVSPATFGLIGIVGVASWGPKNVPTIIGNATQYAIFGNPVVRANDLVTAATVILQLQQNSGAGANLMLSRVTDGTDTAAFGNIGGATALVLTSIYTGTGGNITAVALAAGSNSTVGVPTWKVTVQVPGFPVEVFDNIGAGLTANPLWKAIAAAINNGNSIYRNASQLVVASAGVSVAAVAAGSVTLASGTDGTTTITSAVLVGTDTAGSRTGVYAFRNSSASDLLVADLFDTTQEPTLQGFAQSEGILVHANGPAGETPSAAQTALSTQGTNSPFLKRYCGDWIYWVDNFNGGQRLLGPATFGAALMSTMQPQQSGLNKQISNVVATQRSRSGTPYGNDELAILVAAGCEVIANPIPAGSMFGFNTGRTTTSDGSRKTDNWPRLTSFIARSLVGPGALGTLIGQTITPDFFVSGYDLLDTYLRSLRSSATIQGYSIVFGPSNNPQSQTAIGLVVAQVLIRYFGIAQVFLVNMQTGATVVVPNNTNAIAVAAAALTQ